MLMETPTFDDLRIPCCNGEKISLALLQEYIEAGGDINYADSRPETSRLVGLWTLLHYAADTGDTRSIHILCDCGATVDARTNDGRTPLHLAIDSDFTAATINNRMPDSFPTAEALLRHGADDGICDDDGRAPTDLLDGLKELELIYSRMKESLKT